MRRITLLLAAAACATACAPATLEAAYVPTAGGGGEYLVRVEPDLTRRRAMVATVLTMSV